AGWSDESLLACTEGQSARTSAIHCRIATVRNSGHFRRRAEFVVSELFDSNPNPLTLQHCHLKIQGVSLIFGSNRKGTPLKTLCRMPITGLSCQRTASPLSIAAGNLRCPIIPSFHSLRATAQAATSGRLRSASSTRRWRRLSAASALFAGLKYLPVKKLTGNLQPGCRTIPWPRRGTFEFPLRAR